MKNKKIVSIFLFGFIVSASVCNAQNLPLGWNSLWRMAYLNNLPQLQGEIQRALKYGTLDKEINANIAGTTVLAEAIKHGNYEMVKLLLTHKANVDLAQDKAERGSGGASLLLDKTTNPGIWELLIKHGFNVNFESKFPLKDTPLIKAVKLDRPDLFVFLVENGAHINAQNANGETALSIATKRTHYPDSIEAKEIVDYLNARRG